MLEMPNSFSEEPEKIERYTAIRVRDARTGKFVAGPNPHLVAKYYGEMRDATPAELEAKRKSRPIHGRVFRKKYQTGVRFHDDEGNKGTIVGSNVKNVGLSYKPVKQFSNNVTKGWKAGAQMVGASIAGGVIANQLPQTSGKALKRKKRVQPVSKGWGADSAARATNAARKTAMKAPKKTPTDARHEHYLRAWRKFTNLQERSNAGKKISPMRSRSFAPLENQLPGYGGRTGSNWEFNGNKRVRKDWDGTLR